MNTHRVSVICPIGQGYLYLDNSLLTPWIFSRVFKCTGFRASCIRIPELNIAPRGIRMVVVCSRLLCLKLCGGSRSRRWIRCCHTGSGVPSSSSSCIRLVFLKITRLGSRPRQSSKFVNSWSMRIGVSQGPAQNKRGTSPPVALCVHYPMVDSSSIP
jgi:hypothetical protein